MPQNNPDHKKVKKPWPTKDAMEQVYEMHLWGGKDYDFYSGEGSHHPGIIEPYLDEVTQFLSSFKTPLIVCDLGCGDFNVGKELVKYTKHYHAVDIVESLIKRNRKRFHEKNLEFHCIDLAKDELPVGDCALVRQVLQHLSNEEVKQIVNKLSNYKYVILTEHIPSNDFMPNEDIISGQSNRLKKQSGLDLLISPFNFQVKEKYQLLSIIPTDGNGRIVTTLYKVF